MKFLHRVAHEATLVAISSVSISSILVSDRVNTLNEVGIKRKLTLAWEKMRRTSLPDVVHHLLELTILSALPNHKLQNLPTNEFTKSRKNGGKNHQNRQTKNS